MTVRKEAIEIPGTKGRLARKAFLKSFIRHRALYLMALPGIIFFIFIRLVPTAGSIIAWQDYSIFRGIFDSPWVGWKNFEAMFAHYDFYRIFRNTLMMGLYRVVLAFPVPIILALLINEVRQMWYKRTIQTLIYMPYFLSWVIVSQLFINFLDPSAGIVNIFLRDVLGAKPVFFMGKEVFFQPIVAISYMWKQSGYQSIIYLAALSAIDPQLYEAASIDGASRWKQTRVITIPLLVPTITVVFLLAIGRFLEIGFDQVWTLLNPLVWGRGDIFDTYVYRVGLLESKFSLTTAIGIFKSLIGFTLIIGGNALAKRLTGRGFF